MQQDITAPVAAARRYDIDWLRTLALGLLIVYHVAITFQPWARIIWFIQNDQSLEGLWVVMGFLNVWRIPILFMVSGMGVRFAMERRDWKELLKDRTVRILVPFVFGFFVICPMLAYIVLYYYELGMDYVPNAGHLWFLANIFLYVLLLLPLLNYLRHTPDNGFFRFLAGMLRTPWALFVFAIPVVLEAWLINPQPFSRYAGTLHGFLLGLICFFTGFVFVSLKNAFWSSVQQIRWGALTVGFVLFAVRLLVFELEAAPNYLVALESMSWMLAVLGFGSVYLHRPSRTLSYLSTAVYPVYIIHLPVQYALASYIVPLEMSPWAKLVLLLVGTFGICFLIYELFLKRLKWIRPLFGMKFNSVPQRTPAEGAPAV
ncbi:acyltransferase family protein [candidate division GN15 bacterium]|nr:acyltransferase family protein [candidate division GN15 bacterium]